MHTLADARGAAWQPGMQWMGELLADADARVAELRAARSHDAAAGGAGQGAGSAAAGAPAAAATATVTAGTGRAQGARRRP
jgi:hypothetical protein